MVGFAFEALTDSLHPLLVHNLGVGLAVNEDRCASSIVLVGGRPALHITVAEATSLMGIIMIPEVSECYAQTRISQTQRVFQTFGPISDCIWAGSSSLAYESRWPSGLHQRGHVSSRPPKALSASVLNLLIQLNLIVVTTIDY